MQKSNLKYLIVGVLCAAGLAVVYLFQRIDVAALLGAGDTKIQRFLVNRTIRFLLNDIFMIGIIYALFRERKYVVFAIWVQVAGIIFLLIPYFILKMRFPHYNGPMINFLHRLILNPTLMILLIPAFYIQRRNASPRE
jgi:exosortase F-associated protein